MRTDELLQKLRAGHVDEIVIESMEGGIYLLRPGVEGVSQVLVDEHGRPIRYRSLSAAKTHLREMGGTNNLPLYLRQCIAHNEMTGFNNDTPDDRMPITLSNQAP